LSSRAATRTSSTLVHYFSFHVLPTAYCPPVLTGAGIPLSGMEDPQSRFWGGIPKVKGESETEIPVETFCINNDVDQGTILGAILIDGILQGFDI